MAALLAPGTRTRQAAVWLASFAGLLIVTQLVFSHGGTRGTPAAILFQGLVLGMIASLTAAGIILIYRTSRVINFAQTAIGAAGASLLFYMVEFNHRFPFIVSFVLGLVLAGMVGFVVEIVFVRRFFRAPRLVLTVVTIAMAQFLSGVGAPLVRKLPIFPPEDSSQVANPFGVVSLARQLPYPGWHFSVGHLPLRFGFAHVFSIEVVIIVLLALAAFLRYTRFGVAVRAIAENAERAALLGIGVGALSSVVWIIAAVLSGASASLTGSVLVPGVAAGFAPSVLLPALAAAILARMRSLPVAVAASVGIAVVVQAANYNFPEDTPLISLGLFVAVCAGLLVQRRHIVRSEAGETSSWEASEELRPIPKELANVPPVRVGRWVLIGIGLTFVVVFPFVASVGTQHLAQATLIACLVALSVVVLTGWAGQVSLGQYGFAAVGGLVAAALSEKAHIPFWFAVPMAAAVAGGMAVLVGIPALRIRGLFLMVSTFAFGIAAPLFFLEPRYFRSLIPREVHRPTFFFLDFQDERSMYFLCVAVLFLALLALVNLRRSRFGRLLIAMRENEANVQSFGVNVARMKLLAFGLSGVLAGIAGALIVYQQTAVNVAAFTVDQSIFAFVDVVIGGVGSLAGGVLGALYFNIIVRYIHDPLYRTYLIEGGTLYVLYAFPGGMMPMIMRLRDGVLRIIAQRRQLIVPSLFADIDPNVLQHRLIPMTEAAGNAGLAARSGDARFAMRSDLYEGRGGRLFDKVLGLGDADRARVSASAKAGAEAGSGVSKTTGAGQ